jgi:hypothetical protein
MNDAQAGADLRSCPYDLGVDRTAWLSGYVDWLVTRQPPKSAEIPARHVKHLGDAWVQIERDFLERGRRLGLRYNFMAAVLGRPDDTVRSYAAKREIARPRRVTPTAAPAGLAQPASTFSAGEA